MDFEQALALADWDAGEQGALLIVGAKGVPLGGGGPYSARELAHAMNSEMPPDPPSLEKGKRYPLRRVAKAYGQKIEKTGGLSVLAPETVMNAAVMQETFMDGMTRGMKANEASQGDRWLALLATLSTEQWRKLGSATGLGLGDVTPTQKPLFQAALPQKAVRLTRSTYSAQTGESDTSGEPVAVSPAEVAQTRLRLTRRVTYAFAQQITGPGANNQVGGGGFSPLERTPDAVTYTLVYDESDDEENPLTSAALAGRLMAQTRLRKSDTNLADGFWDKSVLLDGAKTVEDLVARIAAATGAPLLADRALAKKALWTRTAGLPIRAGDALAALCWATTGTVRRVGDEAGTGTAFLLTSGDDEGAGVVAARGSHRALVSMTTMGQAEVDRQRNRNNLLAQTRGVGPLSLIGQKPGDPLAAPEDLTRKIEACLRASKEAVLNYASARTFGPDDQYIATPTPDVYEGAQGLKVSLGALPSPLQTLLKTQVARENSRLARAVEEQRKAYQEAKEKNELPADTTEESMVGQTYTLNPGRVQLNFNLVAEYLFPGDRAAEENDHPAPWDLLTAEAKPLPAPPPLVFPPSLQTRAAQITPQTEAEAVRVVEALAARGFTEVWVDAGPAVVTRERETQTDAVLRAAVATGKKRGVDVRAVLHLFQADRDATTEAPPALRDVNILGETQSVTARRLSDDTRVALGLSKEKAAGEFAAYFEIIRTVFGGDENSDWLRSDTPETSPLIARRLQAVAQTPGLAGVVALDTCPPGFRPAKAEIDAMDNFSFADELQFGFTPRARFAFIQSHHRDPLDLRLSDIFNMGGESGGPEAQPDTETLPAWRAARYAENAARVAEALTSLRAPGSKAPPLLVENRVNLGMNVSEGRFVVPFSPAPPGAKDALPAFAAQRMGGEFGDLGAVTELVRAKLPVKPGVPRPVLLVNFQRADLFRSFGMGAGEMTTSVEAVPLRFARFAQTRLASLKGTGKAWGGVAFDFTGMPTDDVIPLLQAFAASPPKPAAAPKTAVVRP